MMSGPIFPDDPRDFRRLGPFEQRYLLTWLETVDPAWILIKDSRELCEQFWWWARGFEATNGQMKGAFLHLNWQPIDPGAVIWRFRMRDHATSTLAAALRGGQHFIVAPHRRAYRAYLLDHRLNPSSARWITRREHLLYLPGGARVTVLAASYGQGDAARWRARFVPLRLLADEGVVTQRQAE